LVVTTAVPGYPALDLLLGAHQALVDQQKRSLQRFTHTLRGQLHRIGWRKHRRLDATFYLAPQFISRRKFLAPSRRIQSSRQALRPSPAAAATI
jgi:hypothetical protein